MTGKELIKAFYESDIANDPGVVPKYFHEDCELHWSSSKGFLVLNYNDLLSFFEGTRQSYNTVRFEFTHIMEVESKVVTRHTLFANTIEDPENELVLAHFSSIWEIKDNKLYKGYEISQLADANNAKSLESYAEIKI